MQALEEALAPRLSLSGEMAVLEDFKAMFLGRTLAEGLTVALLWSPQEDGVDVALLQAADLASLKQVRAAVVCCAAAATEWCRGGRCFIAGLVKAVHGFADVASFQPCW